MKKQIYAAILLLLVGLAAAAQSIDRSVDSINKRYAEISAKAKACETDDEQGEYGELFINTLTINSRNHQWRAVGIYGQTYKFFYRSVEQEGRLYPDELVLVKVDRKESSRKYTEEYLYSDAGALMLYRQTSENDDQAPKEWHLYFSGQTPLRSIADGKTSSRFSATDSKNLMETWRVAGRIRELFIKSIRI